MTLLTVWPESGPETSILRTADRTEIGRALDRHGVRYGQWEVPTCGAEDLDADGLIAAYQSQVDEVIRHEGYQKVDAVQLRPSDDPGWQANALAARQRFLAEHAHDDSEDRFFARGAGVFYLHLDGLVYAVLCEAGDLLSVPAATPHWFDMGTRPDFAAIRFFHTDDGWVGDFTGNDIASRFPSFDELMAGHRGVAA